MEQARKTSNRHLQAEGECLCIWFNNDSHCFNRILVGKSSAERKEALKAHVLYDLESMFLLSSILRLPSDFTIQRQWRRFPWIRFLLRIWPWLQCIQRNSTRFVLMNHTSGSSEKKELTAVQVYEMETCVCLRMLLSDSVIELTDEHARKSFWGATCEDFTNDETETETSQFWPVHSIYLETANLYKNHGRLSCSSSGSSSTSRLRNSGALQRTLSEYKFALQS